MIRYTLRTFLPAFRLMPKQPKFASISQPLHFKSKQMFCSQKDKESPSEQPENVEPKQTVQKQEKEIKLTEMTNEQLIEINTQEALNLVEANLKTMHRLNAEMQKKIQQHQNRLKYFDQLHDDLTNKQQILLENIKEQEHEFNRVKKRMDKQIEDSKDYAITKLAKELLEVADSLKRCSQEANNLLKENADDQYFKEVVQSHDLMTEFLKLYEIQEFDPTNQPFDPNTSESLVTIPCPPGYTVNNVATTMRTGYRIKDRLLRSARVGIFV